MTDITIVIPHRGNPLGLWATVHSCEQDLETSKVTANYVIVTNGEKSSEEVAQTIQYIDKSGKLKQHIHSDEPLSPPTSRQRGAECADGKTLCFLDNHCLVGRQYFDRVVLGMEQSGADMMHSSTRFYAGDLTYYHYRLRLEYNFWADSSPLPNSHKPYKLACGGHGGFAVRKDVWDEVGGYGPEDLLQGYGGEEMLFDLKMWRYGRNNFIDPKLIHYHYNGKRGYDRKFTDEYYINMLVSANVIGGEKWLYKVYDSFANKSHVRKRSDKNMYELMETALHRSAQYAHEVDAKSTRTLDELLLWFRTNEVAT